MKGLLFKFDRMQKKNSVSQIEWFKNSEQNAVVRKYIIWDSRSTYNQKETK
jgi:hypothetical protein